MIIRYRDTDDIWHAVIIGGRNDKQDKKPFKQESL